MDFLHHYILVLGGGGCGNINNNGAYGGNQTPLTTGVGYGGGGGGGYYVGNIISGTAFYGGGGGYYNQQPIPNGNFNINTQGGANTSACGGTGGNGSISCGGGGGGYYNGEGGAGGNGGGGIVMLYYPYPIALNVVGNASITGKLSVGGGLVPRYQSGWVYLPNYTTDSTGVTYLTTYNNTNSGAFAVLPNLNFPLNGTSMPMCQVMFVSENSGNPGNSLQGSYQIQYLQSIYYDVYFFSGNSINTFYVIINLSAFSTTGLYGSVNIMFY